MSLMRRGAVTCTENMSIREVAQIMVVNRIYYCVVVNENHEVLGVISARSILRGFGMDLDQTKAKDILLHYTVTINPSSPLKEAIDLIRRRKVDHVIVVSDRPGSRTILGLLHAKDIVARMATD